MRKRKRHSSSRIQKQRKGTPNRGSVFFFIGFVMIVLYLWGKIQIDFEHRKNQSLIAEKNRLEKDINQLRTQIHTEESYQRITQIALKQGMVFLSPAQIQKLQVDLDGIKHPVEARQNKVQYATLYPNRLK